MRKIMDPWNAPPGWDIIEKHAEHERCAKEMIEAARALEHDKAMAEELARKISRRKAEYAAWRPGTVIEYDSWQHQGVGLVVAVYDRTVDIDLSQSTVTRRFAFVIWDSRCAETCKEYEIARINPHVIYTLIP